MNIGEAAKASGVSAKMIRYYESIGLLRPLRRAKSGYREFDHTAVYELRFVRRARELGFSIKQIKKMLRLWSDRNLSNAQVRKSADRYVTELEAKIQSLSELRDALVDLRLDLFDQ